MQKGDLDIQEEELKKKLEALEKKHKSELFINDYASQIREQINGDIKKRNDHREKIKNDRPLKRNLNPSDIHHIRESRNIEKHNKNQLIPENEPVKTKQPIFSDKSKTNDNVPEKSMIHNENPIEIKQFQKPPIEERHLIEEKPFNKPSITTAFKPLEIIENKPSLIKPSETVQEIKNTSPILKTEETHEQEEKKKHKAVHEKDYIKKYNHNQVDSALENEIKECAELIKLIKKEVWKVIIGQEEVLDGLIRGLICDGHVLLEGAPGVAKTLMIKTLGEASGCSVKRIQFTVDLLPTDIIGITSYTPERGFEIIKGPIFANFVIGDEINRAPPKTQSALIEGMQEKQVTIGKTIFPLPKPFFVMATKNPLESSGVYTLPEAQMDRFLFNIIMGYPKENEEKRIMEENTTLKRFEEYNIKPIITPENIIRMQEIVKKIYLSDQVKNYIVSIVGKTRDKNFKYADCIAYGASPRASIAMFISSKARALMEGRSYVIPEDVKETINDILRHRLIVTYKATVRGLSAVDLIKAVLEEAKV